VLTSHTSSQRIDVVFEVYMDQSIKDAERANHTADTGILRDHSKSYMVKNWRQILSSSDSKRHLMGYFVQDWERKQHLVGENKQLYVTQESKCIKITKEAVMKVHELACTREEADTRVILHASHAACSGFKSVVIVAADILVLCIAFKKEINCNLYMLISSRN